MFVAAFIPLLSSISGVAKPDLIFKWSWIREAKLCASVAQLNARLWGGKKWETEFVLLLICRQSTWKKQDVKSRRIKHKYYIDIYYMKLTPLDVSMFSWSWSSWVGQGRDAGWWLCCRRENCLGTQWKSQLFVHHSDVTAITSLPTQPPSESSFVVRIDPNNANFFHMMFFLWSLHRCTVEAVRSRFCLSCTVHRFRKAPPNRSPADLRTKSGS